jgi:hypothetical protein
MIKLTDILLEMLEEKKADRCKRIADRKYDKPSAYKSGAIVRCRKGKIWKGLKEYNDLTVKNNYVVDNELDSEQLQDDLIKLKSYYKSLLPDYFDGNPLTDNQINKLIEQFIDNLSDIWNSSWMTQEDKLKLNSTWKNADIDTLSDDFISFVEGLSENWEEYPIEEINQLDEAKKETLRTWFKRKGAPGKTGGWVDCNTCREVDGKTKCKPCGRQKGEKRAKYPSCRPTVSACKQPGKGKKWGKTK